jgi:hypothetical protein
MAQTLGKKPLTFFSQSSLTMASSPANSNKTPVSLWSVNQVAEWLHETQLDAMIPVFRGSLHPPESPI